MTTCSVASSLFRAKTGYAARFAGFVFFISSSLASAEDVLGENMLESFSETANAEDAVTSLDASDSVERVVTSELVERCIPARVVQTTVPEFHGFKIYNRTIQTKLAPDVPCSVTSEFVRDTDLSVEHTERGAEVTFGVTASSAVRSLNVDVADFRTDDSAHAIVELLVHAGYADADQFEVLESNVSWDGPTFLQLPNGEKVQFGFDDEAVSRYLEQSDPEPLIAVLKAAKADSEATGD